MEKDWQNGGRRLEQIWGGRDQPWSEPSVLVTWKSMTDETLKDSGLSFSSAACTEALSQTVATSVRNSHCLYRVSVSICPIFLKQVTLFILLPEPIIICACSSRIHSSSVGDFLGGLRWSLGVAPECPLVEPSSWACIVSIFLRNFFTAGFSKLVRSSFWTTMFFQGQFLNDSIVQQLSNSSAVCALFWLW